MALYDGFFDATQDESTSKYDRAYETHNFTGYFGNVIGSGVCVHENPDSFLVRLEDGQAVVSPGYLFIQGYWLKNDADYPITLPGSGNYAIVAHLNFGTRMIELEARTVETAYTDSLVLAIVSPSSAEDTRHNTDLCGVIDTAGELSTKVEWAMNYIDNEIESKLAAIERDIAAQSAKLDAKIAAVQAVADSITPPPVGTIKFSAAQNVGEEWLRCDGSFVNERDYPELVAALGKLTPSADKVQLLSNGEIGPQISNGVIYEDRMWVYSYSTQKLYGVDLNGGEIKEISVTSEDNDFTRVNIPSTARPIALSIVKSPVDGKARIFLTQILTSGYSTKTSPSISEANTKRYLWVYSAVFSTSSDTISVSAPFTEIDLSGKSSDAYFCIQCNNCVPYVVSRNSGGKELFYMATDLDDIALSYIRWNNDGKNTIGDVYNYLGNYYNNANDYGNYTFYFSKAQRAAYNKKSKDEAVYTQSYYLTGRTSGGGPFSYYRTYVRSRTQSVFSRGYTENNPSGVQETFGTPGPLNIVGEDKMLFEPSTSSALVISLKDLDIPHQVNFGLSLPSGARTFVDGGAYLWGKDIYMLFVGTGIIFSRTLEEGSFGYLDTTDILGQVTQFGYLDYSEDEGALYLLGQDTTNSVKVAKIVLNTLYDYANDGAWLPMIASDGVPAYIKAIQEATPTVKTLKVTVNYSNISGVSGYAVIEINGEVKTAGTYEYEYSGGVGAISVFIRAIQQTGTKAINLTANSSIVASIPANSPEGTTRSITLNVSSYMENGLTLKTQ